MPSTNHLEQEDTESSPLIRSQNQHNSLTKRKKTERTARMLGRIFNPINDMAIGGIVVNIIDTFYLLYKNQRTYLSLPSYIYLSVFGIFSASSVVFELISSSRLNKHSRFILGENYYEHAKTLTEELTNLLDTQTVQYPYRHFEQ